MKQNSFSFYKAAINIPVKLNKKIKKQATVIYLYNIDDIIEYINTISTIVYYNLIAIKNTLTTRKNKHYTQNKTKIGLKTSGIPGRCIFFKGSAGTPPVQLHETVDGHGF